MNMPIKPPQTIDDKRSTFIPPLENGDRLDAAEFERRYAAMPHLKKAELIDGVVYMPAQLSWEQTSGSSSIPPLENGDRLDADEFERRYEAMPHLKKAELIEGVVYIMASPVSTDNHGEPQAGLLMFLAVYKAFTPGVHVADNSTVRLGPKNQPQPDGLLYIEPTLGGQVKKVDGYIVGGPELAAEISASTVSYDLGSKLEVFRRNGVREYIVWRVLDREIDWFVLRGTEYDRLPMQDGIFKSEVFPGLWLDAPALLAGKLAQVHKVLQEGLASKEHQEFVARLQGK